MQDDVYYQQVSQGIDITSNAYTLQCTHGLEQCQSYTSQSHGILDFIMSSIFSWRNDSTQLQEPAYSSFVTIHYFTINWPALRSADTEACE